MEPVPFWLPYGSVALVIAMGIYQFWEAHKLKKGSLALFAECDATKRLADWLNAHPKTPVGKSAYALVLLHEAIVSWEELVRLRPSLRSEKHREWLYSRLPPERILFHRSLLSSTKEIYGPY